MEIENEPSKEPNDNMDRIATDGLTSSSNITHTDNMAIEKEPNSPPKETDEDLHITAKEDVLVSVSSKTQAENMDNPNHLDKGTNENVHYMAPDDAPASEDEPSCLKETNDNDNYSLTEDTQVLSSKYDPQAENMEMENETDNITYKNMHNIATEDVSASSSSAFHISSLDNWTKEEKYHLYLALKHYGSKNMAALQEYILTKSLEEIEAAIGHYKKKASNNPAYTRKQQKLKKVRSKRLIPLASWAKLLTDNINFNELQTEIPATLRLIADLDDIPPSAWTEQIDFRKIYHLMADALEGKSLPDISLISEVLNGCILETALVSRQFINMTTFKNIVSSIDFKEKSLAVVPRPTKDCELTIIRHLASQENYNPLGIHEDYLLPMTNEPVLHPK